MSISTVLPLGRVTRAASHRLLPPPSPRSGDGGGRSRVHGASGPALKDGPIIACGEKGS